jgi:OmpA-OmpF porin, OOP family
LGVKRIVVDDCGANRPQPAANERRETTFQREPLLPQFPTKEAIMESVMEMARGAFAGDTLNRISAWLRESPTGTNAALNDALPASVVGLANQAASDEGSRALLSRFERGDYPQVAPDELNRAMSDPTVSDQLVQSGQGFMDRMFGGRLGGVLDGIAAHTGLSRSSVAKLFGLVGPLVLGLVGKRTISQHLDAGGLRRFLGEEKSLATGMLPGSLTKLIDPTAPTAPTAPNTPSAAASATGRPVVVGARPQPIEVERIRKGVSPWWLLLLLPLAVLLFYAINRARQSEPAGSEPTTTMVAPTSAVLAAGNVIELTRYLASDAPLPKRFVLQDLKFRTDSNELEPTSRRVLDDVAGVLVRQPSAMIRVEGHTDNTGSPNTNRQLSSGRAEATKAYLVERGVAADRIDVAGLGPDQPVAANDTPEGRAKNRRTEIVVLSR